jgi:putative transposase
LQAGYTYHLTHRCHDRRFLLKFMRDRDTYRRWLREAVKRYGVPVYNYSITSNHVHVVLKVDDTEAVGLMMHLVAGAFGQQLNRRKGHEGSVWEHPYQCTIVQNGRHLLNCLRYVSLNMVRAGVVKHPNDWRWCGHDELTGQRSRYRILDIDRLLDSLETKNHADFRSMYEEGLDEALQCRELQRVPEWTEALAVGDRRFVEDVAQQLKTRSKFAYGDVKGDAEGWSVRETSSESYGSLLAPESAAKPRSGG